MQTRNVLQCEVRFILSVLGNEEHDWPVDSAAAAVCGGSLLWDQV